jgi:hypothetical protein
MNTYKTADFVKVQVEFSDNGLLFKIQLHWYMNCYETGYLSCHIYYSPAQRHVFDSKQKKEFLFFISPSGPSLGSSQSSSTRTPWILTLTPV